MSVEATNMVLFGFAYIVAAFCLLFMGYLGWRKLRRKHRRRRHVHARSHQHRDSWGQVPKTERRRETPAASHTDLSQPPQHQAHRQL